MSVITVYFSHKGMNWTPRGLTALTVGNTAVAAEKISKLAGGKLCELRAREDYPFGYDECVERARIELKRNARPALAESADVSGFDTVVLGFPNWCGTLPMPVWTFLESADFTGKTILPFCTNEGSGMSKSERDIKALCPSARVLPGLSIRGSKVGECDTEIAAWLNGKI